MDRGSNQNALIRSESSTSRLEWLLKMSDRAISDWAISGKDGNLLTFFRQLSGALPVLCDQAVILAMGSEAHTSSGRDKAQPISAELDRLFGQQVKLMKRESFVGLTPTERQQYDRIEERIRQLFFKLARIESSSQRREHQKAGQPSEPTESAGLNRSLGSDPGC